METIRVRSLLSYKKIANALRETRNKVVKIEGTATSTASAIAAIDNKLLHLSSDMNRISNLTNGLATSVDTFTMTCPGGHSASAKNSLTSFTLDGRNGDLFSGELLIIA
ncbi:hypothetical protein PoB_002539100 [Plakobranchus ocellatus]|uniref:Flagellin N-terminal domain-containing protein n=1 Tax=Plakobranchus ocellatus TaxID=259542 RepID=A0AAV3ZID5_9GAST|nr:hypothetical protein PoB_002539100 [Plakobranchus ocellatus]